MIKESEQFLSDVNIRRDEKIQEINKRNREYSSKVELNRENLQAAKV